MPKSTVSPENIKVLREFIELVKLTRPDIVHIQAHGFDWFFLAFPFLKDYPIVNTVHDPQRHLGEERYRHLFRIRFGVKNSDYLIVHGIYSKKKLISDYKIPKDKRCHKCHAKGVIKKKELFEVSIACYIYIICCRTRT